MDQVTTGTVQDGDHWLCTRAADVDREAKTVIVRAPSWFDARACAARVLGIGDWGELTVVACSHDNRADVELRWTGDDFNRGGSPDRRRQQLRERIGDEWGPWQEAA